VLLAITTGARRGELLSLRWFDLDMKAGRALVRETKNDEPRTLPLAGKSLEALRALKLNGSARSEYVFPNPSGHPGPFEYFDSCWYGPGSRRHQGLSLPRPAPHDRFDARRAGLLAVGNRRRAPTMTT
jgi:integrase